MTTPVRSVAALLLVGAVGAGLGLAAAKPKLDPESAKFYQTARLIMTKEETKIFERLPDAESRKEFIADFWLKRDPDPDTPENDYRKELEARVEFVNKRFNKEGGPGYNTDRGRVYILMGPPEKIEEFTPEVGSPIRGFAQWWSYYSHQMAVEFIDETGTGKFRMTRQAGDFWGAMDLMKLGRYVRADDFLLFHNQCPDVARVVDDAVDVVVEESFELDPVAHPRPLIGPKPLRGEALGDQLVQDVLLREGPTGNSRGVALGISFSLYVMIYYIFQGDNSRAGQLLGWLGTLTAAATLLVIPLTGWLATRLGKRKTFVVTILVSLVGYALKWVSYDPDHPYWLIFAAPFVAFGVGSLFTLMGSMIADVCDYDELDTRQRREGVFGAIYWWMVKVGMALAGMLTGVMLNASGFGVDLESQPERTLFLLRVFDVGVPLVTSALAILIMLTYEISEGKA